MAFLPRNIVGCLLKKRLTKGGGVTGTPGPLPRYALGGLYGGISKLFAKPDKMLGGTVTCDGQASYPGGLALP